MTRVCQFWVKKTIINKNCPLNAIRRPKTKNKKKEKNKNK